MRSEDSNRETVFIGKDEKIAFFSNKTKILIIIWLKMHKGGSSRADASICVSSSLGQQPIVGEEQYETGYQKGMEDWFDTLIINQFISTNYNPVLSPWAPIE